MIDHPPKVFISYSHDSHEHADRVLALSDRLRVEGVETILDQYETSPPEGWPRWMTRHISQADFVLMCCTETYYRRVMGEEAPTKGLGVQWEGNLILQDIYDAGTKNSKFIPILLEGSNPTYIPTPLRGATYYFVDSEEGYEALYRRLTNQLQTKRPELGKLRALPSPKRQWIDRPPELLINVPHLPPHFLPRPEELDEIKSLLLNHGYKKVGLTGTTRAVGLQGMGGIGKSVLAASLARDPQIVAAFPDGIIWITLGQNPKLELRQADLAEVVSSRRPAIKDVQAGKTHLSKLLASKTTLIILDDVWKIEHARAFDVLGTDCRLLITSRNAGLIRSFGAQEKNLDVLSEDQSLRLLAEVSGLDIAVLPMEAREIARECGHLPLALAMIGAMVRGISAPWPGVLRRLKRADLGKIRHEFSDYPYPDLLRAIEVSIDDLEPDLRQHYLDFAVFPEDTLIAENMLRTLWASEELDELDVSLILKTLADRSLLRGSDHNHYALHDIQFDYLYRKCGDLPSLHNRLLNAYAARCQGGWATGPDDGYFFERVAYHLMQAAREEELHSLLLDFNWLQAKLEACDVISLLSDYDLLPEDSDLRLVRRTILLAAHTLAQDKNQLASQLVGRLMSYESQKIQALLKQAEGWKAAPWLCALTPKLVPPQGALIRTLTGHIDNVSDGVVTPDGRHIVSGSGDHTIKVWDLESGVELRTLTGHDDSVQAVAVTPDGRYIVSGSFDNTLKVWELESGEELRTLRGHGGAVYGVAVTPDGRHVVSASGDHTLKVWELESGEELRTLRGHSERVYAVAVTPDGRRAVSASGDRTLKVWELESGVDLHTLIGHQDCVLGVTVTSDGLRAISCSMDTTLSMWDLNTGEELGALQAHEHFVNAVTLTPDNRYVISGSRDLSLKVWELESAEELRTLRGHSEVITAVAVTPDGRRAISSASDNTLKFWDLENEDEAFVAGDHTSYVTAVKVTSDGRHAVSSSFDGTFKIWDLDRREALRTISGHATYISDIAVTPNGRGVISCAGDGTLKVWGLRTGQLLATIKSLTDHVGAVAVTPDGRYIISGSDSTIQIWDLEKVEYRRALIGHSNYVAAIAVPPDGGRIISVSGDYTLKVWSLEDGKELRTIMAHNNPIYSVAVTPDGRNAISCSYDHTLKVWDLESGEELRTLTGHTSHVSDVAVMPDGCHVISCSADQTLKVWDLVDGSVVASFFGDNALNCCDVAPDGRTIIIGDHLGLVHFLYLTGEELRAEA
jgi:WD40 repeat protein